MLHISMRHVTQMDESWHICKYVASRIRMDHVTSINIQFEFFESLLNVEEPTYTHLKLQPSAVSLCVSHVTNMNESCHTHQ